MSSCLSGGGGGRTFTLGHEMMKSPSPSSSWASTSSSSPSLADSTRKARTPRKRPNQIHNEAAAILSSACPKVFPTKHLTSPTGFAKSTKNPILFDPAELFVPHFSSIGVPGFSIRSPKVSRLRFPKEGLGEISSSRGDCINTCYGLGEDFGEESMLEECVEESIDSVMGKLSMENECCCGSVSSFDSTTCLRPCNGGIRSEMREMRSAREEDDWWRFPTVDPPEEKKNKVTRKSNCNNAAKGSSSFRKAAACKNPNEGLLLKLNYGSVIDSWCEKGSPFLGDSWESEPSLSGAKIDLFSGAEETSTEKKQRLRKGGAVDQRRRQKVSRLMLE